ncbi:MAG: hypothetical protein AB1790_10555 [Pseudomonadota bacterium]
MSSKASQRSRQADPAFGATPMYAAIPSAAGAPRHAGMRSLDLAAHGGAEIRLSPQRIAKTLAAAILLLTWASIAGQIAKYVFGYAGLFGFVRLFHLDQEGNVPTWFSSFLLLSCAILLAANASAAGAARARFARHWAILALIFLFMSVEEVASFHELVGTRMQHAFQTTGVLYYAWVIPGSIFVAIFALSYLRFLFHLPARTRRLFLSAGLLYVGGALGLEFVSGNYAALHGEESLSYAMLTTVEEVLEMAGLAVFAYALLSHTERHVGELRIRLDDGGQFLRR